jgi:hypothetical protein
VSDITDVVKNIGLRRTTDPVMAALNKMQKPSRGKKRKRVQARRAAHPGREEGDGDREDDDDEESEESQDNGDGDVGAGGGAGVVVAVDELAAELADPELDMDAGLAELAHPDRLEALDMAGGHDLPRPDADGQVRDPHTGHSLGRISTMHPGTAREAVAVYCRLHGCRPPAKIPTRSPSHIDILQWFIWGIHHIVKAHVAS